jgi:hypothetical protein
LLILAPLLASIRAVLPRRVRRRRRSRHDVLARAPRASDRAVRHRARGRGGADDDDVTSLARVVARGPDASARIARVGAALEIAIATRSADGIARRRDVRRARASRR